MYINNVYIYMQVCQYHSLQKPKYSNDILPIANFYICGSYVFYFCGRVISTFVGNLFVHLWEFLHLLVFTFVGASGETMNEIY